MKSRKNISIIGFGLALLYGISFFNFYPPIGPAAFHMHSNLIALLFVTLLISTMAVLATNNLGRQALIIINAFMGLYFILLYLQFSDFIEPTYIFMNIAVVLFYSQPSIKFRFQAELKFNRKSILVVDDDEGIQKTLQSILLPNGYSVLTATTGEKGIQVASLQKPDLIILDVILPGIKGRDVCAKLKQDEKTKDIPVIFLTSKYSEDDIQAELAAGAVTHLTKPINARSLLSEVKKIIK